ncbi:AraC-type DNA-binding protein [Gracilibacillus ureilyticus]|uniref:AraC-type DNA-binding protein n=1 Tax=Gracilibacillus ureilyticus TaxID=531814 RepID=A0A1H9U7B5_9BACI|nr:helix-turn-helix domain-containing protein [Gracilibacillus ureilyticus]SES04993.1 AraC-type DNA-binding protein [Gracilibacillus ureilyticus]
METNTIITTALKIHHITDLNTYILTSDNELVFSREMIELPSFMPGGNHEDLFQICERVAPLNSRLFIYHNEWNLQYLVHPFTLDQPYLVVIGPYLSLTPDVYHLMRKYKLTNQESNHLRQMLNQIQVLSEDKVSSYSAVLQMFEQLFHTENNPMRIEAVQDDKANKKTASKQTFNEDGELIKLRYKLELELTHTIEQGDKKKAKKMHQSNEGLFSFTERLPNQPLRRLKNNLVIFNTLLRSAAGRRKVPVILIHRISEKFAFQIENTNQLYKLQDIQENMIEEYCDLIHANSLNEYSNLTKTVIEYLMLFYNKKIDHAELADLCFTHPSHLARKFKQETNRTITAYQQMLRMNEAKFLLKNERISIEEIAWLVGYEDSSYFARVFKKEVGCSPTQYREEP